MPSSRPFQTAPIRFRFRFERDPRKSQIRLRERGLQKLAMRFKTIKTTARGRVGVFGKTG